MHRQQDGSPGSSYGGQDQFAPSKVTGMSPGRAEQHLVLQRESGLSGTRGKHREQVSWPLTFKDHHARLGTDPFDPGWLGQVVAVRVTAGPALVGACILCGEPIHKQCAGRMLAVGGMDVNAVQPGTIPELGVAVVCIIPFKPPLDLRDGAAHGLTVQDHTASRPLLLGQRRLEEASYGRGLAPITTREGRQGGRTTTRAYHMAWSAANSANTISFQLVGRSKKLGGKQNTNGWGWAKVAATKSKVLSSTLKTHVVEGLVHNRQTHKCNFKRKNRKQEPGVVVHL